MNKINVLFNRNNLVFGQSIEQPSVSEIKNTFSLWNASYDDAIRYGGDLTREALRVMNLRHDRKHIIVDTKIHMLMKGMSPGIPGWHVDGSPRDNLKNPNGSGMPDTFAQEGDDHFNRYHLLVTGNGCLTKFLQDPVLIPIPDKPSFEVYTEMSSYVQDSLLSDSQFGNPINVPTGTVVEFDWWSIHTAIIATQKEWRYLIRVCETDYYEPQKDLREVIRMQNQVYAPTNFSL